MRSSNACIMTLLCAFPAAAEFLPLASWPGDGTRTALEMNGELFRNCGRILERWDLGADPPVLLDSLVLDSPPIDLLEWDGLLLILREDGLLEMRHPVDGWDPPIWTWQGWDCATQLLRHGRWLLPVSPWMPLLDLEEPRQPVVAQDPLGGWWDNFGGFHAAFVGDTLLGDYSDCCGSCWDVVIDQRWLELGDEVPQGPAHSVGWIPGLSWDYYSPLAAVDHHLLIGTYAGLQVLDPATMTVDQTLPMLDSPGEIVLASQAEGPLVLASGPLGTVSLLLSSQSIRPVQVLDTLAMRATKQLRLMDNHALLVSDETTHWVSTTDPAQLQLERSLGALGSIRSQAWAGERLLARAEQLAVLEPVAEGWRLAAFLPTGPGTLLSAQGHLAVLDMPGGFGVVNLAATPPELTWVPTPSPVSRLVVLDQVAACQVGDSLHFFDLSTPSQAREMARFACPGATLLDGLGTVVVAGGSGNVRLFHATPDQVDAADTLGVACSMMAMVDSILVTGHITDPWSNPILHLQLWQVADPQQAVQIGAQTIGSVASCAMRGGASRLGLLIRDYWPGWDPYERLHLDLFDVVGGSLERTVNVSFEGRLVPDYRLSRDVTQAGQVVVHDAGEGLRCYQDDSVLSVETPSTRPAALALAAAPNPFNPLTRLSFTLTRPGPVRLAIFDLLGREVARLMDGDFAAGTQQITFDARALASGLYLARLEAEGRTAVAKLALVR